MANQKLITTTVVLCIAALLSCRKGANSDTGNGSTGTFKLSYGDSVIYLKPQAGDYIVRPVVQAAGAYTAEPAGMELNPATGAINVTASETGMRYRVTFTSLEGKSYSTVVLLSGINYPDQYYNLSRGDSLSRAIYNGSTDRPLPAGSFDVGGSAGKEGCVVTPNGHINLAATVRNGLFGDDPKNNARKEVEIRYQLNDGSQNALNSIKVLLYYYHTMQDVPEDLKELLEARKGIVVAAGNHLYGGAARPTIVRPRPPCVIIVGR